ncbi:hypothetical protein EBV26_13595 [bacterium]|nr:hypothetical protein [bacterium]
MGQKQEYNDDLTKRQIQVNEWSYNNKMDTLFIFQLIFISLLFIGILISLKVKGVVGAGFVWYSMAVLLILLIIIIVNRSVYTNTRRDTKYWNRKRFDGDNTVSSPLGRGDASYLTYIDSIRKAYPAPTTGNSGSGNTCKC